MTALGYWRRLESRVLTFVNHSMCCRVALSSNPVCFHKQRVISGSHAPLQQILDGGTKTENWRLLCLFAVTLQLTAVIKADSGSSL